MSLFTELTLSEQASLAGGTGRTRRRGGNGGVAVGGNGGFNLGIANGNQVLPIALLGSNTAGGNQSADGGNANANGGDA